MNLQIDVMPGWIYDREDVRDGLTINHYKTGWSWVLVDLDLPRDRILASGEADSKTEAMTAALHAWENR